MISIYLNTNYLNLLKQYWDLFDLNKVPTTNKYELLRGTMDGNKFVLYYSGKLLFFNEIDKNLYDKLYKLFLIYESNRGIILGADEAGKGETLGPLVLSVVRTTPKRRVEYVLKGVQDSKKLPPSNLFKLGENILSDSGSYKLISPEDFRLIFKKGNLNMILTEGYFSLLENYDLNAVDKIIFDAYKPNWEDFLLYLNNRGFSGKFIAEPKADLKYPSVAAASVLSKYVYEKWKVEHPNNKISKWGIN